MKKTGFTGMVILWIQYISPRNMYRRIIIPGNLLQVCISTILLCSACSIFILNVSKKIVVLKARFFILIKPLLAISAGFGRLYYLKQKIFVLQYGAVPAEALLSYPADLIREPAPNKSRQSLWNIWNCNSLFLKKYFKQKS